MTVVLGLWLALGLVPFGWWLGTRRRVDVWRALPLPAVLVDRSGRVTRVGGPPGEVDLGDRTSWPPPGTVSRESARDGSAIALSGLRDGALVLALPTDPLGQRRDRVLADLGAQLAHDLATPLGALHGHLDLIAHEAIPDAARESVRTCQRELTRLQATAQDLLAFTRLRAGGGTRGRHLAGALAEEATAALLARADERGATLTVEVPSRPVAVHGAEGDLVRALRNLVANALEHGLGTARTVRVSVEPVAGVVRFRVTDSGAGLPDGPVAGGRLGLAIVAEVLTGHGSRLESGPGAGGPSVWFDLPEAP